jgi:hypothetical protein
MTGPSNIPDEQKDITKQIVAFRKFANAPKMTDE